MNNIKETIWEKAKYCSCGNNDCSPSKHRLCSICNGLILYDAYENTTLQSNNRYSWNIDYKIPLDKGGKDLIDNLQAVHVSCNRYKK